MDTQAALSCLGFKEHMVGGVEVVGGEGVGNGSDQNTLCPTASLPHPILCLTANNLASLSREPLPPENQEGDLHSPSPPIQIPQSHSQQCSRLPSGASLPSLPPFAADPRDTLSKPIFPPSCHLLSPQLFQSIPIPAGHSQHPETSLLRIPTGYSSQGPQKHSLLDNTLRPHTSKTQRGQ